METNGLKVTSDVYSRTAEIAEKTVGYFTQVEIEETKE